MTLGLAIDAGGSSTRWALVRLDAPVAEVHRGSVGPLSGLSFLPGADRAAHAGALATVRALARDVAEALSTVAPRAETPRVDAPRLDRVLAGVTGTSTGDAATVQIREALMEALASAIAAVGPDATSPSTASNVTVVSDLELMHAASFEAGEGILVYAGTGSIAVHRTHDERWLRVGGHGYLLDDAGGGFWIGRQALRAWLRAWDAATTHEDEVEIERRPVFAALERHVGSHEWGAVRTFVYGGGRAAVASLVPLVSAAAASGDALAASWITEAGTELARLATILARKIDADRLRQGHADPGPIPVAVAGGVARIGAPLLQAIDAALPVGMTASIASTSPLEAATSMLSR